MNEPNSGKREGELGKRHRHFTYANVMSTLAVFLVIAGGTAIAAGIPKNSVNSKKVKNESLVSKDLKDGAAVTGADVVDNSLTGADVNESSLTLPAGPLGPKGATGATGPSGGAIGAAGGSLAGAYPNPTLAPNSVGTAEIKTDGVQATEVADDSIDSGEIVDFGLSNEDIGVLYAQVNADGSIFSSSGGVTGTSLGTGTYEVDFGVNISNCAFIATQGEGGVGGASGGIMGVTDRAGNAEATFTTVRTDANVLVDRAFQEIVVC